MTKKHKLKKARHLLDNKKGVDQNVNDMLKLIGEANDPEDSGSSFEKSKLSSLIKGFHEDYQYLHTHYKQLINKLEKVEHSSASSDSSDSDSEGNKFEIENLNKEHFVEETRSVNEVAKPELDVSSDKNGWKEGLDEEHRGEDHLKVDRLKLEAELEKLKQKEKEQAGEMADLKQNLNDAIKENEAIRVELSSHTTLLASENENQKSALEAAERAAGDLLKKLASKEEEIRKLSTGKQIAESDRDDLKILLEGLEHKTDDLSNQLNDKAGKCNFLALQLEKAQLAEKEVQNLSAENQKMKNEITMLSTEYNNLKLHSENTDLEYSQLKENLGDIKVENQSLIVENHSLESKLQQLVLDMDGLKMEKEELTNNLNKERAAAAEERERLVEENSRFVNDLEQAYFTVQELEKELESTKSVLNDEIAVLQQEKNSSLSKLQQSEASLESLENELEKQREQMSILKNTNEDLELAKSTLRDEIAVLQQEKDAAIAELEQSVTSVKNLESELEQQSERLSILKQANEELRSEKTYLNGEIAILQEEKNVTLLELQQSEASIRKLEGDLEQQRERISILQQANEDLQEKHSSLEGQLEEARTNLQAEVIALQEDKNKALSDLQQSEASFKNLETKLEEQIEQVSILQQTNEHLQKRNVSLEKQLEEAMANLHAEIVVLQDDKDTALSELQEAKASVKNFNSELEQQREQILLLLQDKEDLQKNNSSLTEQCEEAKNKLQKEISEVQEKRNSALSKLLESEICVKNLESELEQLRMDISILQENNSSLEKQFEEASLEVSGLRSELEKVQTETGTRITDMSSHANDLQKTIGVLSSQKNKVEEDLKSMIDISTESSAFMKEFEERVGREVADHQIRIVCLQQSLAGMARSFKQLKDAYDESSAKASQLEVLKQYQSEQIEHLEAKSTKVIDKLRHLEMEKMSADKDNIKLHNVVQELEAQLQLAKQKLKVTEAESKCKEDSYKATVETSQAEIRQLEEHLRQCSIRLSSLEEHLIQMERNAELGVCALGNQFEELKSLIERRSAHFIARSLECTSELKLLHSRLQDHLAEKAALNEKNRELASRLEDRDRVISDMASTAAEAEQKMIQLEMNLEEKEQELAARMQEKREAIKQLSNAIVYHKNNSSDLIRYIRSQDRRRLPFCL